MYTHGIRRSLGHQMQVDLKESMQSYRDSRTTLQNQFEDLRFDVRDLYTSPIPPSPPARSDRSDISSLRSWRDSGSKFGTAPERAEKQARLAKLQHENSILSSKADSLSDSNVGGKKTVEPLPPIPTKDGDNGQVSDSSRTQPPTNDGTQKSIRFGRSTELKTPQDAPKGKSARKGKKGKPAKPVLKDKQGFVMKLPTIHAVDTNRPHWDSGHNHIHLKGKSMAFERSQVEEECRAFTQRSVEIPKADDPKRTEIKLPPIVRATGHHTKVKFAGHPAKKPFINIIYANSAMGEPSPRESDVHASADDLYDSDEDSYLETLREPQDMDQLGLPSLPVVRLSESKLSKHNLHPTTRRVPRLRLDSEATPSLMSEVTGRSGATGATYMSQDTLEWKERYTRSGCNQHKSRMLSEILHVVRQRMQDNAEDLRMAGYEALQTDRAVPPIDVMVLAGKSTPASGSNTARSVKSLKQSKKNSPNRQLVAPGIQKTHKARLNSYMQRMSQRRRAVEHQQRVRFQLAHMTIREITQSSLGQSMQQAV